MRYDAGIIFLLVLVPIPALVGDGILILELEGRWFYYWFEWAYC